MILSSSSGERDQNSTQNPNGNGPGLMPGPFTPKGQSLQNLTTMVRRQRRVILLCALGALAVAGGMSMMRPARFTAEAVLALDARKVQVLPLDAVVSRLPQESPVLRTELDIIASRQMAELVLKGLGYTGDGSAQRDTVDRLLSSLKVSNDGRSFTISVSYTDRDPQAAATLANAFADTYLAQLTDVQTSATRNAGEWLGHKLEDLRTRLEAAETAAQTFRRNAGLIETNGATLLEQRLSAVTVELAAARSARVGAEIRLATAQELARSEAGIETLSEAVSSPVIQLLRKDLTETTRTLAELEDAGALKSPQIPALKSQISGLKRQIAGEFDRVVAGLSNEVEIARRKEHEVSEAAKAAEAALNRAKAQSVQLNQLEREANANRTVYESFLNRYKQTIEQQGLSAPEARVISRAEPPREPNSGRMPLLILALMGGTGLGFALAFLRTHLDHSVRSVTALESFGIPVVSALPDVAAARGKNGVNTPLHQLPLSAPHAPFSEALRRLALVVGLTRNDHESRVVMVTSAERQVGRTSLCVALARSLSRSGQRVVVVEANAENAQLAAAFGRNAQAGSAPVQGNALSVPLQSDTQSTVHFITRTDAETSMDTDAFETLLHELRPLYDVIIIDAPAISESTDVAMGARLVDDMLMVVRWGRTDYERIAAALRELALCDLSIDGFVLTGVERDAMQEAGLSTIPRRHTTKKAPAPTGQRPPDKTYPQQPFPEPRLGTPRIVTSYAAERAE